MRRYSHQNMHSMLCGAQLSDVWKTTDYVEDQALHCPYYVPLEGRLGADWGVIVNPDSTRFGLLTFEHDTCGCPLPEGAVFRHEGEPSQQGDTWDEDWQHQCEEGWCDDPCEWLTPLSPDGMGSTGD